MPKLRLEGDASGAIRAVTDLHKAQANLVKEGKEVEKQSERLTGALRTTARRAQADWKKYNDELQRLAVLVKKGTLSQSEADAAAKKYYQTAFKGAIAEKQAAKDALAARMQQTAELQKMANAAKQLIQSGESPTDRYKRKMLELGKAFRSGAIDQAQFVKGAKVLKAELQSTERTVDSTNRKTEQTFGSAALSRLLTYAAGFVSIQEAIRLATGELEAYKQLEERRTRAFLTAAQGEASLRENIAFSVSPDEQQALLEESRRIAESRNLPLGPTYDAMGRAYGALGIPQLAIDATTAASKMTRNMEQLGDLAGGIGDVMTTASEKDADIAAAFLGVTAGYARVESPGQVAKNVGKVMAAYKSPLAGSSPAEGAALFAALTVGGADPMGEMTRTATTEMITKSEDFFNKNASLFKLQAEQIDTFDERNTLLLNNMEMATKFFQDMTFRSGTRGALESLYLTPDSDVRSAFEEARVTLGSRESLRAAAERGFKFLDSGELQRTVRRANIFSSETEKYLLSGYPELSQQETEDLQALITRARREPVFAYKARTFLDYGSTWDEAEALTEIRGALNQPSMLGHTKDQQEALAALKGIERKMTELVEEQKKKPAAVGREKVR